MLAPALAVDGAGRRLGQGGGSYDRALTRTSAPVLAVVFDDELLESVPVRASRPPGGRDADTGGRRQAASLASSSSRSQSSVSRCGSSASARTPMLAPGSTRPGVHLRRELAHARRVVAAVLEGDLELDVEHRLEVDPDTGIDDRGDACHALDTGLEQRGLRLLLTQRLGLRDCIPQVGRALGESHR